MAGTRVLLVEDDRSVALVVDACLTDAGCAVTAAACVRDASDALSTSRGFDVAVVDVGLPDGRGFEVIDALRRHDAPCCAVMMTGDPSDATIADSIAAGISEFLAKPFDDGELLDAVARAVEVTRQWRSRIELARGGDGDGHGHGNSGDRSSAPRVVPAVDESDLEPAVRRMAAQGGLTDRERQILELILAGLQNADIANSLSISANTVKYHVRNMLTKLELESRTELFRTLLHSRDETE
jgi:DNA-binding NarL/FixJ family response regulator